MGKNNRVWLDKQRVTDAFLNAKSKKDILLRLGEGLGSANYAALNTYAEKYELELPVYTNHERTSNALAAIRRPIEEVLVRGSNYSRSSLKRRLIGELGWENACHNPECPNPNPTWAGKELKMQLEHINGVSDDNRLENLMFLCPNCHSQTETFCGKNKKSIYKKKYLCADCPARVNKGSTRCNRCDKLHREEPVRKALGKDGVAWPDDDILVQMVKDLGYSETGNRLDCSDNAVRKRIKRMGLDPKTLRNIP